MPKKYRNTWGMAVCDHAIRQEDRSLYVFTHDFDVSRLPEICKSMQGAHRRVIDVQAREGVMTVAIRHMGLRPEKGETQKHCLKRVHAEAASVLGCAFGAMGRYVEKSVRASNGRARSDRRRTFKPIAVPVYV